MSEMKINMEVVPEDILKLIFEDTRRTFIHYKQQVKNANARAIHKESVKDLIDDLENKFESDLNDLKKRLTIEPSKKPYG